MKQEMAKVRVAAATGVIVALLAGVLAFVGAGAASAQEPVLISAETSCETVDLGTLGSTPGSELRAGGSWTTEDCDSRFRNNSDAHTYRFEIAQTGRIRIDVTSPDADSYLYLLDEDGSRIAEDDDGGVGALDARIERELQAGAYLIEATTTAGRARGAADFEVAVTQVATCEPQVLGALTPEQEIEVTGFWTPESCQSIFLTGHPSKYFVFALPQGARVRVDLTSEIGDPVLIVAPIVALRSVVPGQVAHNDDAGNTRNSRIEQYLPPDIYGIEATTFRTRDLQGPLIDFTLTLTIVEEEVHQGRPLLKIEEIDIPTEVVAGNPLPINFRVGNVGGAEFPDRASNAILYAIGPRVFDRAAPLFAHLWPAGVAYHTNEETASATSTTTSGVSPFSVTFQRTGPAWVFTAVVALDGNRDEIGFHGIWHDVMVLSSETYGPIEVEVDGMAYSVVAEADDEGLVTAAVTSVDDPEAEVDPGIRAKAQYTAGVRIQMLDGIFNRPKIAALPLAAPPYSITVPSPTSDSLLKSAAGQFAALVNASGLLETLANGEAINPVAVEDLILSSAKRVSGTYVTLAASWQALLRQVDDGEAMSFADALAFHSELVYAERILSPAQSPIEIVTAARSAEQGWDDPQVRAMLASQPICNLSPTALRDAYEATGIDNVDELIALDTEMRAALPVYGLLVDGALCEASAADAANLRFLERLAIDDSDELLMLFEPEEPPAPEPGPAPPIGLRILARLVEDGRIEHGVELASGLQILPERRFLPTDTEIGMWHTTQDVDLDGSSLGQIQARRLADGRVEVGFRNAEGDIVVPDIAYLPADPNEGVWYRSSLIEVPQPPEPTEDDVAAE